MPAWCAVPLCCNVTDQLLNHLPRCLLMPPAPPFHPSAFPPTDFNYNTSSASLLPGQPAFDLPGNVHQGFAAIATSLWPGLQSALQNLVASPAGVTNVYVAGHSLGAGVATLLSYGVQVRLMLIGEMLLAA